MRPEEAQEPSWGTTKEALWPCRRATKVLVTYRVKGGIIGGFGGGWLEHQRQLLGARWVGLFPVVPSYPKPPVAL